MFAKAAHLELRCAAFVCAPSIARSALTGAIPKHVVVVG